MKNREKSVKNIRKSTEMLKNPEKNTTKVSKNHQKC